MAIRIPIMDNNMIFIKKSAKCNLLHDRMDDISVFVKKEEG